MKPMRVPCLMLLLLIVPATPLLAAPSPVLAQLLKDYDEANLRLHPSTALWRGDTRYLDRYEDDLTAAYLVDAHKNNTDFKTRLNAIDRAKLDAEDQLSYDIFAWQLDDDARLLAPGIAEHFQMLPIDQFNGAQVRFPTEMEWRGKFPFRTAADYEKAAHRMKGFAHWIDTAIARMREGMAEGVTQPRVIVERMIPQAEEQANKPVEDSVFYAAIRNMPASIKGGTRTRLATEYRDVIAGTVIPAYRRLASFLKTEYLPKACRACSAACPRHLTRSPSSSPLWHRHRPPPIMNRPAPMVHVSRYSTSMLTICRRGPPTPPKRFPCMNRCRGITCSSPCSRRIRRYPIFADSMAPMPLSKAGAFTRSRSGANSASTPTPINISACYLSMPGGPAAWWWIPACIGRAGVKNKPSHTY
jgi:hypothetical protein